MEQEQQQAVEDILLEGTQETEPSKEPSKESAQEPEPDILTQLEAEKQRLAEQRQVKQREAEVQALRKRADEVEGLKAKLKADPLSVLKQLGWTEEKLTNKLMGIEEDAPTPPAGAQEPKQERGGVDIDYEKAYEAQVTRMKVVALEDKEFAEALQAFPEIADEAIRIQADFYDKTMEMIPPEKAAKAALARLKKAYEAGKKLFEKEEPASKTLTTPSPGGRVLDEGEEVPEEDLDDVIRKVLLEGIE